MKLCSETVGPGLKTLRNVSGERGDEHIDYFKSVTTVTVHVECRKNYTKKFNIESQYLLLYFILWRISKRGIFYYLENNNDCQFTMEQLKGIPKNHFPADRTITTKLIERYVNEIIIHHNL